MHQLYQHQLELESAKAELEARVEDRTRHLQAKQFELAESEQHYRTLADNAASLLWLSDTEGGLYWFNSIWLAFTGRTLEQEQGYGWAQGVHPDDLENCLAAYNAALVQRQTYTIEYRLRRADGAWRWLVERGVARYDSTGAFTGYIGSCIDITDNMERQAQLEYQLRELKTRELALDQIPQGIVITGTDRKMHFANRGFERLTGYRVADVLGRSCRFLHGEGTDPAAVRQLQEALTQGRGIGVILRNYRHNGESFWNDLTISPVTEGERLIGFVGVQHDVTALMDSERTHRDWANHDALTGLPNRRLLADRWQQWAQRSSRSDQWAALLYLDLDRFKPLNDTHGHEYGDCLLVQIAQRLCLAVRATDTVARVGGDEFVLLLGDLDAQRHLALAQACEAAEKIRQLLCQPYELQLEPASDHLPLVWTDVGVSVGMALFKGAEPALDALLRLADQAMYTEKLDKRDRRQVGFCHAFMASGARIGDN